MFLKAKLVQKKLKTKQTQKQKNKKLKTGILYLSFKMKVLYATAEGTHVSLKVYIALETIRIKVVTIHM